MVNDTSSEDSEGMKPAGTDDGLLRIVVLRYGPHGEGASVRADGVDFSNVNAVVVEGVARVHCHLVDIGSIGTIGWIFVSGIRASVAEANVGSRLKLDGSDSFVREALGELVGQSDIRMTIALRGGA